MGTCKVYILDDYRKEKRAAARDMKAIIEEHLAEAGLYMRDPLELLNCLDGNLKYRPAGAARGRIEGDGGDER